MTTKQVSFVLCNHQVHKSSPTQSPKRPKKHGLCRREVFLRQIGTELLIDTLSIGYTASLIRIQPSDFYKQIIISYQNDILLVSLSSVLNNFFLRGLVYFISGFLTTMIGSIISNGQVSLHFSVIYAISMMTLSNFRYITVHKLENMVSHDMMCSIVLRIVNNVFGSLQYLFVLQIT